MPTFSPRLDRAANMRCQPTTALSAAEGRFSFGCGFSAPPEPVHPKNTCVHLCAPTRLSNPESNVQEKKTMLWTIFVILLILWLLGFSFHVAGSLIHLLLVIAVIVLIVNLVTGRRTVV
jgi:hypothetical protein